MEGVLVCQGVSSGKLVFIVANSSSFIEVKTVQELGDYLKDEAIINIDFVPKRLRKVQGVYEMQRIPEYIMDWLDGYILVDIVQRSKANIPWDLVSALSKYVLSE